MYNRKTQSYAKWHNYTWKSTYHITLKAKERGKNMFGILKGERVEEATIELNEIGQALDQCLKEIPKFYPNEALTVKAVQVMPDHAHLVLKVERTLNKTTLGRIISGVKAGVRHLAPKSESASIKQTIVEEELTMVRLTEAHEGWDKTKSYLEKERTRGSSILEDGFYARILLPDSREEDMVAYVLDNPRRAWIKHNNPELFKIKRELHIQRKDVDLKFSALGNQFLLKYPCRQVVACSRTMSSDQLLRQMNEAMSNAENGAVSYSAAINDNEKKIAKAIREAGYPMVVLLKDGFPQPENEREKYFKPGGVYFDSCAQGQLLLIEPYEETFTHPTIIRLTEADLRQKAENKHFTYSPLPTDSLRYRYVALNNIAQLICGNS